MKTLQLLNILLTVFYILKESSATQCKESEEEPWSYDGKSNGPSQWGKSNPKCNGQSQSPIDLKYSVIKFDYNLKHLEMTNYDKSVRKAEVINNGHTVMITPQDNVNRSISINGMTYNLNQLHFHWGSKNSRGSEHLFNSKAYAMEAHFVHTNEKGGIAVVGVLYQADKRNNKGFEPISEVLPQIRFKDEETQLKSPLALASLLPGMPLRIIRYTGSLTTPPCTEGVTWSVARNVLSIGKQQLKRLRSLFSVTSKDEGCHLQDNFRPVQPLNNRPVTASTS